jgi:phosphate starvation-inducible PhoH-like protein
MLKNREVERLILSRPAVEAGERLGFLPGDLKDKVDPYLRPLYDALHDMMPADQVERLIENGEIEIAPLAFMRGRTLANSYIILDEAQNTTPAQMKMFLTRMGENSHVCITGDLSQIDLPIGAKSGLNDALEILRTIPDVRITEFFSSDVVRHRLVTKIVNAYDQREGKQLYTVSAQ